MVAIRLRPKGKKKQKTFRLVVDKKQSKHDGDFIEDLGWINRREDEFDVDKERADYWLSEGAQPTDAAHNLLVRAGVIEDSKKSVHSTKEEEFEGEEEKQEEAVEEESEGEDSTEKEKEKEKDKVSENDQEEDTDEDEEGEEEEKDKEKTE
ncbi:MAG: 30S ribosomal protein S16 [Candidatus Magasanikbacteria bacterium]